MAKEEQDLYKNIEAKFEKERLVIFNDIQKYILMLKNINQLSELQVLSLSIRQRLLEEGHSLMIMHNSFINKQSEIKRILFDEINNNMQMRTRNLTEKNIMVEGNSRYINTKTIINLFTEQINYYTDSIKTVDHILYGIKSRMSLEELMGI